VNRISIVRGKSSRKARRLLSNGSLVLRNFNADEFPYLMGLITHRQRLPTGAAP